MISPNYAANIELIKEDNAIIKFITLIQKY